MGIERVRWKPADHTKQSKLFDVEDGLSGEAAGHEQSHGPRSLGMEVLQTLQDSLIVFVKNTDFRLVEDKGCQSSEQNRRGVETVDMK